MIQKIIIVFLLLFSFFSWNVFASSKVEQAQKNLDAAKKELDVWPPTQATIDNIANAEKSLENAKREDSCSTSNDCIDKASFMIETGLFSVGGKELKEWTSTSKELINKWLGTIIQKLMIALWVISLLIMTIWAGYIILYHWEDEYLTKWKWIFTAGIVSLAIALSSYYIVNIVAYILYQ